MAINSIHVLMCSDNSSTDESYTVHQEKNGSAHVMRNEIVWLSVVAHFT
jgi:hypothetical protein